MIGVGHFYFLRSPCGGGQHACPVPGPTEPYFEIGHGRMILVVMLCRAVCLTSEAPVAQVRYLKVIEKSGYQALPWVRYITTAGEYEIRMG